MPTLTQLEYILAVEKYRHFGKAAEACNVSQPTLSQQIQKIEDELGIIIFDRIQKPVLPTEEGLRFLEQARAVVREHGKLIRVAQSSVDGLSGEFRLGLIPTVSSYLLPLFIEDFSKRCPNVELFVEESKTETILQDIRNDRLDGAIMATPTHTGFKEHALFYEPFLAYFAEGHPLLKKSKIRSEHLDASEMWMLKDGNCFKDQVALFCSMGGQDTVFKNIHFQSGSLDTLRNLVQKSRGYTMIPMLMAELMNDEERGAHVRGFEKPTPSREISFVYRRDHWKLDIIDAIKTSVLSSLPDSVGIQKNRDHRVLELC